jgi:hypothetical protein
MLNPEVFAVKNGHVEALTGICALAHEDENDYADLTQITLQVQASA